MVQSICATDGGNTGFTPVKMGGYFGSIYGSNIPNHKEIARRMQLLLYTHCKKTVISKCTKSRENSSYLAFSEHKIDYGNTVPVPLWCEIVKTGLECTIFRIRDSQPECLHVSTRMPRQKVRYTSHVRYCTVPVSRMEDLQVPLAKKQGSSKRSKSCKAT